jgi:hypothetical protein
VADKANIKGREPYLKKHRRWKMYGRNFTGRNRTGGAGFGFRGSSPPYPYIGRGRGGLPRCQYPGLTSYYRETPFPAYNAQMTTKQELDLLKKQASEMKKELDKVESRIHELQVKKEE